MIAYDLFCGLGGWAEGFLAEGYEVIGFDIEAHDYGTGGYPGKLILRDVRSIHGSELKDAAVIVASPPCQAYSYRAMPWKRAKALPAPDNTLFNECFRIQREAIEAAGHYIPLIIENVRGAQKWVGRAQWNYGSFYLWGDVPALMPLTFKVIKSTGRSLSKNAVAKWGPHNMGKGHLMIAEIESNQDHIKNGGGSWFNIGSPGQKVLNQNPVHAASGLKLKDQDGYQRNHPNAFGWKAPRTSSSSSKRKLASAMIAKIPFPLSNHIAKCFKPVKEAVA